MPAPKPWSRGYWRDPVELARLDPLFATGHRVFLAHEPDRGAGQGMSRAQVAARTSALVVSPTGLVVDSDRRGWVGLPWRRLADRLVSTGATIEEVQRGAQDAEDGGAAEAAGPLPE